MAVLRKASPHASRLRRDQTDVGRQLWFELRGRRLAGFKFKRQVTIGPFIADFCCLDQRLVVELDGGQHRPEIDALRTRTIETEGYRVLRFWNNNIIENRAGVLVIILAGLTCSP